MGAHRAVIHPPVVLFDGVCNLCNASVLFIIKRDRKARIKFASLQSGFGQEQMKNFNLSVSEWNSVLLIRNDRLYQKSEAALEITRLLDGAWPVFYIFKIVPRFIRDGIYSWIARNRYR
jgi:predicted DCC family thiol-disulfide oxidoreductase YuxK